MADGMISTVKPDSGFKTISRWASLTKDILASVKDIGTIAFFVLIFFFRDPFIEFLNSHHITPSTMKLFDVELSLNALQMAGDAKQLSKLVSESTTPSPALEKAVAAIEQSTPKIEEVESKILQSSAGAAVGDWAIVVAGQATLEKANLSKDSMHFGEEIKPQIFKKRDYFRIVVQSGNKDAVEKALVIVRKTFPDSYLVSLSRWCGNVSPQEGYLSCSAN